MSPIQYIYAGTVATLLAAVPAAYFAGRSHGGQAVERKFKIQIEQADERMRVAEVTRLKLQAERDRLTRELEDAANAEPVSSPACFPASRVRRLDAIR
jgi:hypothetical protein